MENITLWLGIIMSIILFGNKILLLINQKSGWLVGALGTVLAVIYLLLLKFPIMATAEIGIIVLMLYGFFAKETPSEKVEWFVRIVAICTFIFIAYFTFSGILTIVECLASIFALFGVYLFTHKKEFIGWFFYCICHLLTVYMAYEKHQDFFEHFQIASAIVSMAGMVKVRTKTYP
jgi:hypothetical protein